MRKTARCCPELVFYSDAIPSVAYYDRTNHIRFDGMSLSIINDDELILLLNHEIEHWAQMLFLDEKERSWVMDAYNLSGYLQNEPFIEKINKWDTTDVSRKIMHYIMEGDDRE